MYPSLYDLFNKNFRKVGDINYAKNALGDSNTQIILLIIILDVLLF